MTDENISKPGLFSRLLGREAETAAAEAGKRSETGKRSWVQRLKEGLSRSSSAIGQGLADILSTHLLDCAMISSSDGT